MRFSSLFYMEQPEPQVVICEGGNASALDLETGKVLAHAEKMDLKKFDRTYLKNKVIEAFNKLNSLYKTKFKEPLWDDMGVIESGYAFTGSTEFFFSKDISDADFVNHKPVVGDIDVAVNETRLKNLWEMLKPLQGKELCKAVKYIGQNKLNMRATDQINAIFEITQKDFTVNVQVDFEGAEYDGPMPTPWAKFSHNSSWEDITKGFKGVNHKYYLMNLIRSLSKRTDIIILTPASPTDDPSKVKVKKMDSDPRMLAFSVTRGMRVKYEAVNGPDGKPLVVNGKIAFKELPTESSSYEKNLETIFEMTFNKVPNAADMKQFESFTGCLELSKKYLKKDQAEDLMEYLLIENLWGPHAQALERGSAERDFQIKNSMVQEIFKALPYLKSKFEKTIEKMVNSYYVDYDKKRV